MEWGLCHSNAGIVSSYAINPAVTMTQWGDLGGEENCGREAQIPSRARFAPFQDQVLCKDSRCLLTGFICQI